MELLESPEEAPGWAEDGAALLGGKAGRAGIVQPGEGKLFGELIVALQCLKWQQETRRETIYKGWRDRTQGMASTDREEFHFRCLGGNVVSETLAQGAQSSCGCPIPGSVQGQGGQDLEQPGLVGGVPAHGRGGTGWSLRSLPSQTFPTFVMYPASLVLCHQNFADLRNMNSCRNASQ
ncbi:hypothetical protein WISP_87632 [Willisornis vidua]|uniref:Uncharacterized protein n=1 Tax=Willisornis vidua TaxID=1566151 RepID=A0ABQ9D2I8_9PASS|nr:hypothetical protein WISP_87632 [Willisornis vidua]